MSLEDLCLLVGTHEFARLGVTYILQLPPPLLEAYPPHITDCPRK